MSSPLSCSHCSTPSPAHRTCSRCKQAYYCNVDCQKAHWKDHKPICERYAPSNHGAPPPPPPPSAPMSMAESVAEFQSRADSLNHDVSKFLDVIWDRLLIAYGQAINVPNSPGLHTTHILCLDFRYEPSAPHPILRFKPVSAHFDPLATRTDIGRREAALRREEENATAVSRGEFGCALLCVTITDPRPSPVNSLIEAVRGPHRLLQCVPLPIYVASIPARPTFDQGLLQYLNALRL